MFKTRTIIVLLGLICVGSAVTLAQDKKTLFKNDMAKIDAALWDRSSPSPDSLSGMVNGEFTMFNRVFLWPKVDVHVVEGKWTVVEVDLRWLEDPHAIAASKNPLQQGAKILRRQYADNPQILVHTSLELAPGRSWESLFNLKMRLDAGHGKVSVETTVGGKNTHAKGSPVFVEMNKDQILVVAKESPRDEPAVESGVWFRYQLKFDGENVELAIKHSDKADDARVSVMKGTYSNKGLKGLRVGLGNREVNSGIRMMTAARRMHVYTIAK